jgi:hypothetical protein
MALSLRGTMLMVCMSAALAGCGLPEVYVPWHRGQAPAPPGPTALLKVTTAESSGTISLGAVHAVVKAASAESSFAVMAAHFARCEGGMEALDPHEVAQKLKAAGVACTLQPDDKQLADAVSALGCSSYMTAHIERWRYSYRLWWVKATVRYTLCCYAADTHVLLWTAQVDMTRSGVDERQVAAEALRSTFRALAVRGLVPGRPGL